MTRWLTYAVHTLGVLFTLLLASEFFEIINSTSRQPTTGEIVIASALVLALLGFILGIKYHLTAAIFLVLAYITIAVVEQDLLVGPIFPFLLVAGFIHTLLWKKKKAIFEEMN